MKYIIMKFLVVLALFLPACGSVEAVTLEGTSWELVAYRKTSPIEGSKITISFEDGQAGGSSGCNSYSGGYEINGDKIEFGPLMSTLMACADPAMMEQETTFIKMLGEVQRFEIADGRLVLKLAGNETLTFIPAEMK